MEKDALDFWMAVIGTLCWPICFWWMHRISEKQNRLLGQLTEQGRRIEMLSKAEHDLIKDVHPKVGEIQERVGDMLTAVKANSESKGAAPR